MKTINTESKKTVWLWWLKIFLSVLVLACVLFLSSGKLNWVMAWVYLAIVLLVKAHNAFLISVELMAERSGIRQGTKKWDIFLARFVAVTGPMLTLIVSGLDMRYSWSSIESTVVSVVGILLVVLGGLLINWSMSVNMFFSATVRIQDDRNHQVVNQGPYRFVRHPGYVGAIVGSVATPLVFNSWFAFIPASLVAIGFIIRTGLEDKVLRSELSGYAAYAQNVNYRLLPYVW